MLDKSTLQAMVVTHEVVDAFRFKKSAVMGGHGLLSSSVGGNVGTEMGRGIPCAFVAMLATRDDIDDTLDNQRPPYKLLDLLQCYASDLRVPGSYIEAMRSEHANLWKGSTGREVYGLLDAGTFEPVWHPVDNFVNAVWVFD